MGKDNLWNNEVEVRFFKETLKSFASPEQLFYKFAEGYFAYVPKHHDAEGQTIQSRNSLIGQFTEKWCKDLLSPIARELNLFAINGAECEELGLTRQSSADLAFCVKDSKIQNASDVKLIFEIKMSIVSNYSYDKKTKNITYIGDYKSHKGNPALLRSDSMLKAIGKAINIRVSGISSTKIPILVLGNSPITDSYTHKVDYLKKAGVVQGFISLNPKPTESEYIEKTEAMGFQTIMEIDMLQLIIAKLIKADMNYFSSMLSKNDLGKIITIAAQEKTEIEKAEKFLSLIRG